LVDVTFSSHDRILQKKRQIMSQVKTRINVGHSQDPVDEASVIPRSVELEFIG